MDRKPDYNELYDALDRQLAGEGSVADQTLLKAHMHLDRKTVSTLQFSSAAEQGEDSDRVFRHQAKLDDAIAHIARSQSVSSPKGTPLVGATPASPRVAHRYNSWNKLLIGATAAVMLVAGWFGGNRSLKSDLSTFSSFYSTANGRLGTATLSDGTKVHLNVGSEVEVPSDFATGNRVVKLRGEAAFSVVQMSGKPFRVITQDGSATVLGTEFVVRRYQEDAGTSVSVYSGKVSVAERVVGAGQGALLTSTGNNTAPRVDLIESVDSGALSFKSGLLVVSAKPLHTILPSLERWYDVSITFDDANLLQKKISGSFGLGSTADLIEIFEDMLGVKAVKSGDSITFSRIHQ